MHILNGGCNSVGINMMGYVQEVTYITVMYQNDVSIKNDLLSENVYGWTGFGLLTILSTFLYIHGDVTYLEADFFKLLSYGFSTLYFFKVFCNQNLYISYPDNCKNMSRAVSCAGI